jgi:hypothetical protein
MELTYNLMKRTNEYTNLVFNQQVYTFKIRTVFKETINFELLCDSNGKRYSEFSINNRDMHVYVSLSRPTTITIPFNGYLFDFIFSFAENLLTINQKELVA